MKWLGLLLTVMLSPFSGHAAETDLAPTQALEVSVFYGKMSSVIKNLSSLDAQFPGHTLYMVVVDDMSAASIRLFVRSDKEQEEVSVFDWNGRFTAGLQQTVDSLLREGPSQACAQGAMASALKKQIPLKDMGTIPAPVSTWAAFAHVIKQYDGKSVRAAIYLLC